MPRDGSGTYTTPVNSVDPAVTATTISSADFNALVSDITTEMTDSLDRSGKGAMLAALAMGGFKITNVGAPVATTDAARKADLTLAGDVTGAIGTTNVAKIQGVTVAGVSGTGNVVFNSTLSTLIASVTIQTFTATGTSTYTPNAKMLYCIIDCWGGGGGGGGTVQSGAGSPLQGCGGGGGGYARRVLTAAQVGASQTVTIGGAAQGGTAGNNAGQAQGTATSVGTLVVATGGSGGLGNSGAATFSSATAPGIGTTGDDLFSGSDGQGGMGTTAGVLLYVGGEGGAAGGGGGGARAVAYQNTGQVGRFPGGGGSGAHSSAASAARAGGNGALGYVRVTEYNSA